MICPSVFVLSLDAWPATNRFVPLPKRRFSAGFLRASWRGAMNSRSALVASEYTGKAPITVGCGAGLRNWLLGLRHRDRDQVSTRVPMRQARAPAPRAHTQFPSLRATRPKCRLASGSPTISSFSASQRSLRPVSLRAAAAKRTHSISARRATSSHQSYSSVCGPVPCRPAYRRDRSRSRCHLACPFAGRRLVAKNRVVLPRQHPGHSTAVYSPLRR